MTPRSRHDTHFGVHSLEAIAAFDTFALKKTRTRVMTISWAFALVFTIALVVGQAAGEADVAANGRILLPVQAFFCALCWAVLRFVPAAKAHPTLVACLTHSVVAYAGGYLLGDLGGLDSPAFYGIYTLPTMPIALPLRLRQRIAITIALLIPYLLAYFVPHPEYLSHPLVHIPILYVVTISIMSVTSGHWIYNLPRDRFLFARQVEEQRAELALHNKKLSADVKSKSSQVERLSERIETVRIDVKSDLARTLHDDLGQLIVGARMELGNIEKMLSGERPAETAELEYLYAIVESLARSTKRIVGDLRDERLDRGVAEGIEALIAPIRERSSLEVEADVVLSQPLSPAIRELIYRTVQEGMTNLLKHAKAARASVSVKEERAGSNAAVLICVVDDGCGFDVAQQTEGWGLVGLRERVEAMGGRLHLRSGPQGTRLEIRIPIHELGEAEERESDHPQSVL